MEGKQDIAESEHMRQKEDTILPAISIAGDNEGSRRAWDVHRPAGAADSATLNNTAHSQQRALKPNSLLPPGLRTSETTERKERDSNSLPPGKLTPLPHADRCLSAPIGKDTPGRDNKQPTLNSPTNGKTAGSPTALSRRLQLDPLYKPVALRAAAAAAAKAAEDAAAKAAAEVAAKAAAAAAAGAAGAEAAAKAAAAAAAKAAEDAAAKEAARAAAAAAAAAGAAAAAKAAEEVASKAAAAAKEAAAGAGAAADAAATEAAAGAGAAADAAATEAAAGAGAAAAATAKAAAAAAAAAEAASKAATEAAAKEAAEAAAAAAAGAAAGAATMPTGLGRRGGIEYDRSTSYKAPVTQNMRKALRKIAEALAGKAAGEIAQSATTHAAAHGLSLLLCLGPGAPASIIIHVVLAAAKLCQAEHEHMRKLREQRELNVRAIEAAEDTINNKVTINAQPDNPLELANILHAIADTVLPNGRMQQDKIPGVITANKIATFECKNTESGDTVKAVLEQIQEGLKGLEPAAVYFSMLVMQDRDDMGPGITTPR